MTSAFLVALTVALAPAPEEKYSAYWLIRDDQSSKAGYVPLLVTRQPLEQLADLKQDEKRPLADATALTVITYKKDSLWNVDRRPFKVVKTITKVDAKAREITLDGATYRLEEAALKDVLRLVEKPEGTMPIHRIHAPLAGAEEFAAVLKERLKKQLQAAEPSR